MSARKRVVGLTVATIVGVSASQALAAWTSTGSGNGASAAGTLEKPGAGSVNGETSSSLTVHWSAPSAGVAPSGYRVYRDGNLITAGSCDNEATEVATAVSCTDDNGLSADTTYTYTVKAVRGSAPWVGPANDGFTGKTLVQPLTVQTLTLANKTGGNAGRIDAGDTIAVDFSRAIRPKSVCSSLSDTSSSTQTFGNAISNNGLTLTLKDNATAPATTNDQITLSAGSNACGGSVNFGTLDLGSPNWTTQSRNYNGANTNGTFITLNGAHTQLVVTLGSGATTPPTTGGNPPPAAISSATSTFTPSSNIKDDATNAVGASGSKTTTTLF